MRELSQEAKQYILNAVHNEKTYHLRPTALVDVKLLSFFGDHANSFDGWIVTVLYADGHAQDWFVVVGDFDECDIYLEVISRRRVGEKLTC